MFFKKKAPKGNHSTFDIVTPEEKEHRLNMLVYKIERRAEIKDSILSVLKIIFFIPLAKILRLINMVLKLASAISILGFFVGVYNGWKFYNQYQALSASGDYTLLKSCIFYCLLPFILAFGTWATETLADKLEY